MTEKTDKEDPLPPDTAVPIRPVKQKVLAVIIIGAVLTCGWFVSRSLLNSKPEVRRRQPAAMKTVVQVQQLKATDLVLEIEAMGTVIAAQELDLKPRVSGRVVVVNPKLVPGSLLNKDELILKIDKKDYELALESSRNNLRKASMDLRLEQGNQTVAKREFDLIREYASTGLNDAPLDLALRKPQLAKATAAEAVARTQMQQAKLNLERTILRAPFNGVVLKKNVAVGAQISPQTTVAKLAGTDEFWIRITLPRHDLTDILLPSTDSEPIQVTVLPMSKQSTKNIRWQGTILQLLPDVDPQGLMARLLISVQKPLLHETENPLLLGSMVKVLLPGKTINACFAIPRTTVRPDNTVLMADPDNKLEIRSVTVARMNRDLAYITAGLTDGERLIISPVPAPIGGMKLSPATGNTPGAGQSAP
ncbi:MAG: efflux RND transporter periplasmic adaptor subunit [Deltaproteobacteria bacterium]|nr:efflux RND transporter periplasmic adaptor subunit [Deltaproteobacteria bacterium]